MSSQAQSGVSTIAVEADTCGSCHSDAACTHGCNGSYTGAVLKPVVEYRNAEVVLRIAEKASCTPAEAEELFEEMKRYLARSAMATKASSPTRQVDIAWHEFILFTRDYAEFCEAHFGRFVHHIPTPRLAGIATSTSTCETMK